jgi:uncharacterized protein (DUF1015 family)
MRLFAFQGLRYSSRAGDAGRLAAPPYDQIDDAARDRFQAASPYQFVHLTRPVAPVVPTAPPAGPGVPPPGPSPYQHAAELHRRWLRDGIIARDEQPALYPYVVELAGGGRRLGVMALVAYAPPTEIRPHEQTIDKPLAERLALLEATRVDLEPALLLAEDDGQLDRLLAEDLDGRAAGGAGQALPAMVDYRDPDGHHHRLFRIADPARIAAYQAALAARPAAIADGHHRYKVGQLFAAAHPAAAATAATAGDIAPAAAAAKLAVVTSIGSPALTIDPIHRALRQRIDLQRLRSDLGWPAAGAGSTAISASAAVSAGAATPAIAAVSPFGGSSGAELARAVAAAPQPALGVWVAGGRPPEIWQLSPAGRTPGAAPLVVEIFQRVILPALGIAPAAATDGTLVYRSDPGTLYDQVESGELGTGFWLPPMRPAEFAAAIAHGELLPPKSTRFLPKAMSGLVWCDHQSRVI